MVNSKRQKQIAFKHFLTIFVAITIPQSRIAFAATTSFRDGAFIVGPLATAARKRLQLSQRDSSRLCRPPLTVSSRSEIRLCHGNNEHFNRRYVKSTSMMTCLWGQRNEDSSTEEDNISGDQASMMPTSSSSKPSIGISLTLIFGGVVGAILLHASAYSRFFASVQEMQMNAASPEEFTSAMTFWSVAAILHPILQPIFAISEVLHGTPIIFISGMAAVALVAVLYTEWFVILFTAAFLTFLVGYIGSGLEGDAAPRQLLADYNIALDDPYQGKVVKGCPTYEQIRQQRLSSGDPTSNNLIDNFDLQKYAGIWYWQKVHDWTQFKEVYDTTLDISINDDQSGYVNKLSIKGPSPSSSPYSWDKSPLAVKGAQYFWSGSNRVANTEDSQTTTNTNQATKLQPGYFMEKGFGVKFPNYIMDVKLNGDVSQPNAQYDELIQFQCIEVGGVRLYEGIDFMSRQPTLNDNQLDAMHVRAKNVGLDPYGANPEQMHRIERRRQVNNYNDDNDVHIDNAWQTMWKTIGFDELLDRLSQIEEI